MTLIFAVMICYLTDPQYCEPMGPQYTYTTAEKCDASLQKWLAVAPSNLNPTTKLVCAKLSVATWQPLE